MYDSPPGMTAITQCLSPQCMIAVVSHQSTCLPSLLHRYTVCFFSD
ncbi:hypothetical protein BRYFOR_08100 [Marvinbryantia formatexigens DSM 14469]|uniref:Uncharacterized protein n=1 Tax=Marvinbryantia formatexigens DSM 14469 TaxID=478749 RepID=C6LHI9_9FIRM|nr:hypothetical protein BRYFOR_08100 [Marvinbryantia formatexigens DSM 14469]